MITRDYHLDKIRTTLKNTPIVALLGPRQCGKTTLARQLEAQLYLNTENSADEIRLQNPAILFSSVPSGTIVIDEVQRTPHLFPFLRFWVDHHPQQS